MFDFLSDSIKQKLCGLNITEPTEIQKKVIPLIIAKKNVIFQSETGTGKTFCFVLPTIQSIFEKTENEKTEIGINAIIVAPTFELASQIKQVISSVCDIKTQLLIGGTPLKRQIENLKEKPKIIVGTVARILELIELKKIKTDKTQIIIFDEVDRLLKKELFEESKRLLEKIPQNCQKVACSATIDKKTQNFFGVKKCTPDENKNNSDFETVILQNENILTNNITHWAIYAETRDKIEMLKKFIYAEKPQKALIFTSRADQVENIYSKLAYKKIPCLPLHAKSDKQKRKEAIDKFKNGKINYLVTSDLSSRGLDIQNVTHIIQMDLNPDEDFFIHRAGRTARAGKKGINVVIGDEYEMNAYSRLEKKLGIIVYPKIISHGKIAAPNLRDNTPKK